MNAQQNASDVEVVQLEARPVLSIRQPVSVAELGEAMGDRIAALWAYMQRRGAKPGGPVFVRYHTFGDVETDFELGFPVVAATVGEDPIAAGELPGGPAVTTWHLGPHDSLANAYGRIAAWLEEHDRQAAGPGWEVYYWIDPRHSPDPTSWHADPSTWRTQLIQPIHP